VADLGFLLTPWEEGVAKLFKILFKKIYI